MNNSRKIIRFIGTLFAVALMFALATGASYPATVISANAAANPEIEIEETKIEIEETEIEIEETESESETEAVVTDSIMNAAMSKSRRYYIRGGRQFSRGRT